MKRNLFSLFLAFVILAPLSAAADNADYRAKLFGFSYAEAEEAVGRALADKGVAPKVSATINGRGNEPIYSHTGPLRAELRGLRFDRDSNHWSANLLLLSEDGNVVTALPASGRYDALAEVPVLKHPVRNGEVINAADIEIRDVPMAQARYDVITDISSLIGKSPAQSISANRPIRIHEVQLPAVVKKNSIVYMHYTSPGLEISTTGQALEAGAQGAVIGVRNISSKKIVQAIVTDSANVSVRPPMAGEQAAVQQPQPSLGDLYANN